MKKKLLQKNMSKENIPMIKSESYSQFYIELYAYSSHYLENLNKNQFLSECF